MARCFSGRRLHDARLAASVQVERLALDIGRSCWTIISYERGASNPPANVIGALADAIGCEPGDFFDDKPKVAA